MPPDWRTFAYVSAIVFLAGILSGLAPALESVKVDISGSLKGYSNLFGAAGGARAARHAGDRAGGHEHGAAGQRRSLRAVRGPRPPRRPGLLAEEGGGRARCGSPTAPRRESARVRLRAIADRMRSLPGARAVAYADDIPMLGHDTMELRPPGRSDASLPVDIYTASPGFFETMGVPLMGGREFNDSDRSAVVVSQSLAIALLARGRIRSARRCRCPTARPRWWSGWRATSNRCASAAPRIRCSTACGASIPTATSWRSASTLRRRKARSPSAPRSARWTRT